MASIGSFVPKNLLKVLSSDPHRISSIVIRCASTSRAAPSKPPIETIPPQTDAATEERLMENNGSRGTYAPTVYED